MFNYKGEITFTHSHEEAQNFLNLCIEAVRNKIESNQSYDKDDVSR